MTEDEVREMQARVAAAAAPLIERALAYLGEDPRP